MPSLSDQTDRILADRLELLRGEAFNGADPGGPAYDLRVHQIEWRAIRIIESAVIHSLSIPRPTD